MVVGERFIDEGRAGRRSRGASPNGHLSDDSSATDDSDHGKQIDNIYIFVLICFRELM